LALILHCNIGLYYRWDAVSQGRPLPRNQAARPCISFPIKSTSCCREEQDRGRAAGRRASVSWRARLHNVEHLDKRLGQLRLSYIG
jgi:hypothetical protein